MKRDIKTKIFFTICLVIFLTIIGVFVYNVKNYYNTDEGKTKTYKRELKDKLNLQGNKTVIKIIKNDFDKDNVEDYIVLLGEEKFEDNDTTKNTDVKKVFSNVEMYNNICVDYINGKNENTLRYDTKKSYGKDVDLYIKNDSEKNYIIVSDKMTGHIAMLYLKDEKLNDLIAESFSKELVGYTIEAGFKKDDTTKLEVKLDNYGRDYLPKKDETYTLDYKDTSVNKDNYRLTYMANKFCEYEVNQGENNKIELIGIQNILYCNKEDMEKTSGKVKIKFNLNDKNKFVFKSIEVVK